MRTVKIGKLFGFKQIGPRTLIWFGEICINISHQWGRSAVNIHDNRKVLASFWMSNVWEFMFLVVMAVLWYISYCMFAAIVG